MAILDHPKRPLDAKVTDGDEVQISQVETRSTTQYLGEAGDEGRTLWQNIKKYRKVGWITIGLTSGILLYGYDNVIIGSVSGMPRFQQDFGRQLNGPNAEWILPSEWLALWNFASPVGAMAGSLAGGWMQDKMGRRLTFAFASLFSAVAVGIMYASYLPKDIGGRRGCFLAGKLIQGIGIGAVMTATQTYMSEILPPCLRGSGMAFFPAFTLLGQLIGAIIIFASLDRSNGYSVAFGSQWPFSFLPVVVACFIPESPAYYVRKHLIDRALAAQARLDPPGADTKAIVARLKADIEYEQQSSRATFAECFHRRNIRRTAIVMWASSLTAVFGLQLLGKASYFLQKVGMKASLSLIFLILGIVLGLIANGASVWVVSRVGRRPLILMSLGISAGLYLCMGIANCFESSAVQWVTSAVMMLVTIVCGVGAWPASFAVAAETSSLQLRAKTQGIGWFASAFASAAAGVALPYVFNPDAGGLRGKVGFTYVGSCLVGLAISWYLVPEMKGRNVGDIDRMFELNLPARRFKSWRSEDDTERRAQV